MTALDSHPMRHLFSISGARSRRASSWDRSGGNSDWVRVGGGETVTLAEIDGPGMITHLYSALALADPLDLREAVLRMYWDGEDGPSVEVPLGDFFCQPHARVCDFSSALIAVNPGMAGSHGMNAYFPMPFSTHARLTLSMEGASALGGVLGALWYQVDYEELEDSPGDEVGRFHAQWRREAKTQSSDDGATNRQLWTGTNLTGDENFVMLDARGRGQLVGIHLQVDNIAGGWWGEGDDMYFVDGEVWPPSIHGTGTEEIFGGGACPQSEYASHYTGFHLIENLDGRRWGGKSAMYRWFSPDPIRFSESLRATVEHGHANNFENDYTSVAYWYQSEPHAAFPTLPSVLERYPRLPDGFDDLRARMRDLAANAVMRLVSKGGGGDPPAPEVIEAVMGQVGEAFEAVYRGDFAGAETIAGELDGRR